MSDNVGTGYKLDDFSVGDRVTLEHMFSDDGEADVLEENYGVGLVGIVTSIRRVGRTEFPISVSLTRPNSERVEAEDTFSPNEIAPIYRAPDWEV